MIADFDNDHYGVVKTCRLRLAVRVQTRYRFCTEKFNLKKLSEVEGKEQ
jgi:hypothetical protein